MKKQLLALCLSSACFYSTAQITFQKTYGGTGNDWSYCVQQTSDGGYVMTGYTESFGAGGKDVYVVRTNSLGDTLWTKTFGGTSADYGQYIRQNTDGGFIITGFTNSFGAGLYDVYLIRTDVNGDTLWTKTFGGSNIDYGMAVNETTDGGYIIVGYTYSFNAGNYDAYLIKTDTNGDTLWTKKIDGTYDEQIRSVQQTSDGGYVISGFTKSFGAGFGDVCLIKTNLTGNIVWIKTYGGSGVDEGNALQQTADGGYIIAGVTANFGSGLNDVYLIKTNANGDTLWTKAYGGINHEAGYSVQQTSDGGYIIGGSTSSFGVSPSDVYLIRVDNNGDTLWTKTYGGASYDGAFSVEQTSDGGFIVTGNTASFPVGGHDFYLIKTDANGNSGCNQGTTSTTVSGTGTIVSTQVSASPSTSTLTATVATLVGAGSTLNTLCLSVAVDEISRYNSFLVTPNPSTGDFIISFAEMIEQGKLEMVNIVGEIVYSENISRFSRKEINLKNISEGIYVVKIFDGEKNYCKKLIVKRN